MGGRELARAPVGADAGRLQRVRVELTGSGVSVMAMKRSPRLDDVDVGVVGERRLRRTGSDALEQRAAGVGGELL